MFLKHSIFFYAFSVLASGNLLGQTNIQEDSIRHTVAPPITVTSDSYNDEIAIHPADIHSVSTEQLESQTGAARLSDALQVLHPSLDIRNYGSLGGISLASFRGLPAEYIGVYWEGICITDPQHSFSDLGLIDLKSVQSVGVISAGNAQLLGGDVAGAGILLGTNTSEKQEGLDVGPSLLSYNDLSSIGEKQLDLGGVYKISDRISFAGGFNTAYSDGAFPFQQLVDQEFVTVIRENNDAHLLNANLTGDFIVDTTATVKALSYFTRAERGVPYVATIDNRGASNFQARQYDENFLLGVSFRHQPLANVNYTISAGYQSQYETYNDVSYTPIIADHYLNRIYSIVWKSKTQLTNWSDLFSGVDYTKDLLFSNENSLATGDTVISREHYSAYVADKIRFLDNFDATVSLRYERLSDIDKSELLPSISFQYLDPVSSFRIQSTFGRIYHPPTFNELYWRIGGNPNLFPERGSSTEISAGLPIILTSKVSVDLQATLYQTSMNDQIIWQQGKNNVSTPSNIQSSRAEGIEFIGGLHYLGKEYRVDLREGLSLMSTKNLSNDSIFFGKELPYSTPMRSSMQFQVESIFVGSIAFSVLYRGHRYKDFYNDPNTKLPPVTLFDLIYSTPQLILSSMVSGTARICLLNLGNTQYEEIPNFPLPGRSIRMEINFHFSLIKSQTQ